MSSISPADLYMEMRSDPAFLDRLYNMKKADDIAALVYEFAMTKGHKLQMSDIFDGIWDAQNIVNGTIAKDAMNDNEVRLAVEGQNIVVLRVGDDMLLADDELTDAELEMVSAGVPESCTMPKCPEGCSNGEV